MIFLTLSYLLLDLEWWLSKKGVITTSELEEDPRTEAETYTAGRGKISSAANFAAERNVYHDDDDD